MDCIGNIGYLYRIAKVDQAFVATQIDALIVPVNVETFGMFKDTLNYLLELKYFMKATSTLLKQELCQINLRNKLRNIARTSNYITSNNESPYIFIPPKRK